MGSPKQAGGREHPLAWPVRKQDIMRFTQRAVILATAAVAALAPAAATTAAAASASPAKSTADAAPPVIRVTATIPVGGFPVGVAADPRTNSIYVTNNFDNTVSVISGRTKTVTATIPVGINPFRVAANPKTNTIYVTNTDSGTVSVINGRTN